MYKKINIINLSFGLAIFLLFLQRSTTFFEVIGIGSVLSRWTLRPASLLLILAAYYSVKKESQGLNIIQERYRFWLKGLIFWLIILVFYGLFQKSPFRLIINDLQVMLFFIVGIFIGARKENWYFIEKTYINVLFFGLLVNVFAISMIPNISRNFTYNSIAYKIQYLIWPVLFFLLTVNFRRDKKIKFLIITVYVINIIEQLIFQKRLELFKFIVILFPLFIIIKSNKIRPFRFGNKVAILLTILMIFYASVNITIGYNLDIFSSWDMIMNRFMGNYGVVETTTEDNRWKMAGVVIDNIRGHEILIGKGLGSYIADTRLHWNASVGYEEAFLGVTEIEVGHVWPYWKGGIILFFFLNSIFIFIMFSYKNYKNNPFLIICWSVVTMQFFYFFSGAWSSEDVFSMILLGLCIGQCISAQPVDVNELYGTK
ncbi:MAG: hypothetical protein ACOY90_09145 [Candidatus Zhuqueibacterota bacterium]